MVANYGNNIICEPPCETPDILELTPSTSANWCNAANDQIVVLYQSPGPDNTVCPPLTAEQVGDPYVLGWFDAAGVFTRGNPPPGYRACGERRDFELVSFCALTADNELIQEVAVQYEYDEVTGELINTTVLNPDGTPYSGAPYDRLGVCPFIPEATLLEVPACLRNTADPTCSGVPVKVIQSVSQTVRGQIDEIVDRKIFIAADGVEVPLPLAAGLVLTYGGECSINPAPYIASLNAATLGTAEQFTSIAVHKPECCTVELVTSAGTITLTKGMTDYNPPPFNCFVTVTSATVTEGDCTPEEILVYLQRA